VTVRHLHPSNFWLLSNFISTEPRELWVREAESFLTQIAPSGMGDARGSSIVVVSDVEGRDIAASVFRPHPVYHATHLQCFVVRPELRGQGLASLAFVEIRDSLTDEKTGPGRVIWAVREANSPMLGLSRRAGAQLAVGDGLIHFAHP
jgi:ribosomal protein S18 acetylase RimI-like enzyme